MNDSFNSLNDIFNVDNDIEDCFDEETQKTTKQLTSKAQKYTLEDLEYMKTELQDRIASDRIVAEEMKQCCKVGAPPRIFEVYAKLSSNISENVMKLAALNKMITDYQVTENKEELHKQQIEQRQIAALKKIEASSTPGQTLVQNNIQNTYNMTSSELLTKTMEAMNGGDTTAITKEEDLPVFNLE